MTTDKNYDNPSLLIETDELAARLSDPGLRIIDCDIILAPKPEVGYDVVSGLGNWSEVHIPNSIYIDIGKDLSADNPRLHYMLPPAEQFADIDIK